MVKYGYSLVISQQEGYLGEQQKKNEQKAYWYKKPFQAKKLLPRIEVFYRPYWTNGGIIWKWILKMNFKYKNKCFK